MLSTCVITPVSSNLYGVQAICMLLDLRDIIAANHGFGNTTFLLCRNPVQKPWFPSSPTCATFVKTQACMFPTPSPGTLLAPLPIPKTSRPTSGTPGSSNLYGVQAICMLLDLRDIIAANHAPRVAHRRGGNESGSGTFVPVRRQGSALGHRGASYQEGLGCFN